MNNIPEYVPEFFTKIEYDTAKELLRGIAPEDFEHSDFVSVPIENQFFDEKYPGSFVKQPRYMNCEFWGTKFDGIDGLASSILNCKFFSVRFKDAGMNFSDFSGTQILNQTVINNCGYTGCNFTEVKFDNVEIEGSTFDRSFFIRASIENSIFIHCSFEDSVFDEILICNSDFTQTSLEFSTFNNVKFKNAILPFWGILKSFNGIQNIASQNGQVTIKYSTSSIELSVEKFLSLLVPLQPYFYSKKQYFILANINIFFGNQKVALTYTIKGLLHGLDKKDFRMIRNLCKLASNNHFFTKQQLRIIYDTLNTYDGIDKMNDHEYRMYLDEMDEIKRILVDNPYSMAQMNITFITSIDSQDYKDLALLLQFIDGSINQYLPQCSYYLTIRHNSPPVIDAFISDILPNSYNYFIAVTTLVFGLNKGIATLRAALELQGIAIDNEYREKQLKLDIEKKRLENDKLKEDINQNKLKNLKLLKELDLPSQNDNNISSTQINSKLSKNISEHIKSMGFSIRSVKSGKILLRKYTIHRDEHK